MNPLFRRDYSALYKAIEQFNFNRDCTPSAGEGNCPTEEAEPIKKQQALLPLITEVIPAPVQRSFYLFGLDVTPVPRPYARTLEGRTFIYQPNTIQGNKPINIGHPYSILSVLPERTDSYNAPWCIPLSAQRVLPHQKGTEPMWLIAIGQHRNQLSCLDIYQAYRQRFDLEHLLRFGKQRLLMGTFQTPEAGHEENWIQLTLLAYTQLWLAKELAQHLPRPWERYLEQNLNTTISPSVVQRDFTRIITSIGTPAKVPKTRGYSSGRAQGASLKPRTRHPVIKKDKKQVPKPHNAA